MSYSLAIFQGNNISIRRPGVVLSRFPFISPCWEETQRRSKVAQLFSTNFGAWLHTYWNKILQEMFSLMVEKNFLLKNMPLCPDAFTIETTFSNGDFHDDRTPPVQQDASSGNGRNGPAGFGIRRK
jgi:hypothetical protein